MLKKAETAPVSLRPALEHLPAALVIGLIAWWLSGRVDTLFWALALGWLVDVDHLLDMTLVLAARRQRPTLEYFLRGRYFGQTPRVYVLLHAWEGVALWLATLALAGRPDLGLAGSMALAAHLAQDQRTNIHMAPWGYFITWRALHSFDKRRFLSLAENY